MLLVELFKLAAPFNAVRGDKHSTEYRFEVDGTRYEMYVEVATLPDWQLEGLASAYGEQVAAEAKNQPALYVEFSTMNLAIGRYALTGQGNAPRIFSTVIEIINDALTRHQVRYIKFDAKEKNRQSLYKKMAQRFGKQVFEVQRKADPSGHFGDNVFIVKL